MLLITALRIADAVFLIQPRWLPDSISPVTATRASLSLQVIVRRSLQRSRFGAHVRLCSSPSPKSAYLALSAYVSSIPSAAPMQHPPLPVCIRQLLRLLRNISRQLPILSSVNLPSILITPGPATMGRRMIKWIGSPPPPPHCGMEAGPNDLQHGRIPITPMKITLSAGWKRQTGIISLRTSRDSFPSHLKKRVWRVFLLAGGSAREEPVARSLRAGNLRVGKDGGVDYGDTAAPCHPFFRSPCSSFIHDEAPREY